MRCILNGNVEHSYLEFFESEMQRLLSFCDFSSRLCVGVSGGSDSICLLWLLYLWCRKHDVELHCVTVDHQLRSESYEEACFVRAFCNSLNIQHEILKWNHPSDLSHGKLENLAREARYEFFVDYCKSNDIHIICVAHIWDDQLETYQLRKALKSTEIGLAGMSQVRSLSAELKLIRPVLHFTKVCLQNILRNQNIMWKEDPMNDDESFKRVAIRKKLKNIDSNIRMKMTEEVFAFGSARHEKEIESVEAIKDDVEISKFGFARISLEKFLSYRKNVQKEILRRLIWNIGGKKYPPTISDEFLAEIFKNRVFSKSCMIFKRKNSILIFRENRNLRPITKSEIGIARNIVWDNRFDVDVDLLRDIFESKISFENSKLKEDIKNNFIFLDMMYHHRKSYRERQ